MKQLIHFFTTDAFGILLILLTAAACLCLIPRDPCDTDAYLLDMDLLPKDCPSQ